MRDVNKILPGCYYPGCDHDHDPGKKFCGCDHKYLSPQRQATFPDHPVVPKTDAVFTHIPGSEDMAWDDEPEGDDWMDDPVEQESWMAKRLKEIK